MEADSDFADLFEVKDALKKVGSYQRRVEGGELHLAYERETFRRETIISSSAPGTFDDHGVTFNVHIDPHAQWTTDLDVTTSKLGGGTFAKPKYQRGRKEARPAMGRSLDRWLSDAPRLESDWEPLRSIYRRCLVDLAALRFSPPIAGGRSLPAAGLPWFMTMFGRDSIFTSLQSLPFAPELAATTLRTLGDWQGSRVDDFRDEDPGRILHEMRYGEMAAFEERPHSPYYGSVDATPLYVVLLDEYERWTGDRKLVRELEYEARAALHWIDAYADRMGNGFISYKRRNEQTGLENQSWKDSWNSISYSDGRSAGLPPGDAVSSRAMPTTPRCAAHGWRVTCGRIRRTPTRSRRRRPSSSGASTRPSGCPDRGYYALALDADGQAGRRAGVEHRPSPVERHRRTGQGQVAGRAPHGPTDVFRLGRPHACGGRRADTTPSVITSGTVWPFDNSIIAWGLRRYGYKEEAARIASDILDAAEIFEGRLPEAFGGYDRSVTKYPVQYPTACSPQAWSTGAPILLLRTMLGLEPMGEHLIVDPALPRSIGHLELLDIPGRWGRIDAFGRGRLQMDGHHASAVKTTAKKRVQA